MRLNRLCSMALGLATLACAGASNPESDAAPASASQQSEIITITELDNPALGNANLLEAVRRLRPRFLNARGPSSISSPSSGTVHVSIDGGPLLGANTLASYRPSTIAEVRYLNSSEATLRYGVAANGGGVILVKSR